VTCTDQEFAVGISLTTGNCTAKTADMMLPGFGRSIVKARPLAVLLALGAPAMAADSRMDVCANDKLAAPDRIVACTNVLEDKAASPSDQAIAYFDRGNALDAAGEYDRALSDYNKAIALDPKDADALNNRGLTWSHLGEAIRRVRQARAWRASGRHRARAARRTGGHIHG
jgi:tetratricopeptide (TPR) repeat protein